MKPERIANALMSGGVDEKRARDLAPHLAAMIRDEHEELRKALREIAKILASMEVIDVGATGVASAMTADQWERAFELAVVDQ